MFRTGSQFLLQFAVFFSVALLGVPAQASGQPQPPQPSATIEGWKPLQVGYTLPYGSGVIMAPHAYVAPGSWDLFLNVGSSYPELQNTFLADEVISGTFSWRGRAEVGLTSHKKGDYAVHAKFQVLRPTVYRPAVAVGVLDLFYQTEKFGRHGLAGAGGTYNSYIERASPYIVASYATHSQELPWATGFALGWGAGHFLEDNPAQSSKNHLAGFFGSAFVDVTLAQDLFFRLALEHDGWDFNGSGMLSFHGMELAIGLLAIDEGYASRDTNALNQVRAFIRFGFGLRGLGDWWGL